MTMTDGRSAGITSGGATSVATIDANCSGRSHQGAIARGDGRFVISIDGRPTAQAGSLESAAGLASALRQRLPRTARQRFGVAARCVVRADVGIVFGNLSGGGGGGGGRLNRCVGQVIAEYQQGANNLERALEFAARVIGKCCGSR